MNDTIIMENYLSVLKSNVEVFVHGTLESSYDDTQKLLKKCLEKTIESQRNTYKLMTEHGMYKIEKITPLSINECLQKIKNN